MKLWFGQSASSWNVLTKTATPKLVNCALANVHTQKTKE